MSTTCDWFERGGPERVERGESLEPHILGCAACRRAHARYLRLGALIGRTHLVGAPRPSSDFMARLQKIAAGVVAAWIGLFVRIRSAAAANLRGAVALGFTAVILSGSAARARAVEGSPPPSLCPAPAPRGETVAVPEAPAVTQDTPAPSVAAAPRALPPSARRAPLRGAAPASAKRAASPPRRDAVRALVHRGLCLGPCPVP